ncbi:MULTISPECIES: hypothetical protein [Virgibacillus]|uniref:hypothetical protein n=1 Tax=Virgibacillus TaxID=84406 RepID=UPI000428092F|nr:MULTISPECIES: hypothetical protein [Bacillaceae]MDY7045883.1 hypothetical protein [Virgibacillus sp. M23]
MAKRLRNEMKFSKNSLLAMVVVLLYSSMTLSVAENENVLDKQKKIGNDVDVQAMTDEEIRDLQNIENNCQRDQRS